jgi:hypothetical protein
VSSTSDGAILVRRRGSRLAYVVVRPVEHGIHLDAYMLAIADEVEGAVPPLTIGGIEPLNLRAVHADRWPGGLDQSIAVWEEKRVSYPPRSEGGMVSSTRQPSLQARRYLGLVS